MKHRGNLGFHGGIGTGNDLANPKCSTHRRIVTRPLSFESIVLLTYGLVGCEILRIHGSFRAIIHSDVSSGGNMKVRLIVLLIAAGMLISISGRQLLAHHSFAATYFEDKQ